MALFRCMTANSGGGGSVDQVNLFNQELMTPNPYTYNLSKSYTGVIITLARGSDSAIGNPIYTISVGSQSITDVTLGKNATKEIHFLNTSGNLTINRTSGSTGQNAIMTIDFIGIP